MQHARKPGPVLRVTAPVSGADASEGERWPAGVRIMFMIGAAVICWVVVLVAGWWLIG